MSGGSLDYFFSQLREHVGDFGDVELDDLVKDLAELFEKLRDDFGLNDHKRCETCGHWTQSRGNYGSCKFESEGLIYKGEVCKKWEEREDVKALEIQL